jgi:UDP-N-acetylmuramate dehydrogenase
MRIQIQQQVPLSEQCRFRVGGSADHFAQVSGEAELGEALAFAAAHGLRYFVYGGGSNVFFDDAGFRGLVVRLTNGGIAIDPAVGTVTAGAGFELAKLIRLAAEAGWGGAEFLGNIPGSLGGAIAGNAGCYGRSIAEVLERAVLLDAMTGEIIDAGPAFMEYGYRHSRLKAETRYIVTAASLRLAPREPVQVINELEQELADRLDKHPHEAWCAGSYFKNPGRHNPAWQLITDAGMKGAQVGGAQISPKHANFLINAGSATSADILALTAQVQRAVQASCGVELRTEVRYVSPTGPVDL